MPVMATRGASVGECNICGDHGPLTEDHTPPKSTARPTTVVMRHLSQVLSIEAQNGARRILQNGVRYRTLCSRCNNHLLGILYDPALAYFCNGVAATLNSSLVLPSTIHIPGLPQRITRAVFGHIAAQGVGRYLKGPLTVPMRDWFLNENAPLPSPIRFLYWPYPYMDQVLMRDAAILDIAASSTSMIWQMKFYPVAFAMLWDSGFPPQPVRDLNRFLTLPPTQTVDIPVDLRPLVHRYWPEAPTDNTILAMGQEAVVSQAKPPRGKA